MKRVLITIVLGLILSVSAYAQKTVAVYVTASEGVPQETKRILGSELVAAITRNPDYVAIERTDDFLAQVSQEQGRYNNIDDKKLFELGQKYGASNVCVAEITKYGDEYYIVSRLLDIRTQRVWKTARKSSELKSLGELMSVSEAVADELIGNTKEFSTYAYGDNSSNQSFLTKIENRENYTKVTFKFVSISPTQQIGISSSTYIEDLMTHEKFNLKDAANINIMYGGNKNYKTIGEGIWEYSLFFDRITEDTKNIMIVEPNGWAYKDIVLKPYGDENTFVFEDNTQIVYNELLEQKNIRQQQLEEQYNKKDYSTYAYGDNGSKKSETISNWFNSYQRQVGENGDNRSYIIRIENSGAFTKVTCKFISLYDNQKLGISEDTYIEDLRTHNKYKLKNTSNINISSSVIISALDKYSTVGKGIIEYTLFFERIPEQTRNIQIVEKYGFGSSGWEYKNILLKPYGQQDVYVFEDNTDIEYKNLSNSMVCEIHFNNTKNDPQDIYLDGKYLGRVKGRANKMFKVSVYGFGRVDVPQANVVNYYAAKIEAIQASGFVLYPDKYYWNIQKFPKIGDKISITY